MDPVRCIKYTLRISGIAAMGAIFAVLLPQSTLAYLVDKAEPGVSAGMLVTYLARVLSAMYVLLGLMCYVFSTDVARYRPAIWSLTIACLIAVVIAILYMFCVVPPAVRSGFFWFIFSDVAIGSVINCLMLLCLYKSR